jgi:hypothetical protein
MADVDPGLIDAAGCVATDVACLGCGYNLRTLRPDGACPECGAVVAGSLRGDLLGQRDADWLNWIAVGLGLLVVTLTASVAVTILHVVLYPLSGSAAIRNEPMYAYLVVETAARVLLAVGAWMFTTRDPVATWSQRAVSLRAGLRVLAAGQVLTPLGRLAPVMPISWQGTLLVGINVGCLALALAYVRHLARRVPDAEGERSVRHLLAWIAGALLLTLFGLWAEWMWPRRFQPSAFVSIGLVACVAIAFPIILCLGRFQRVLVRVADDARRRVADEGAA